jgi:outer membrane protein assembly factor BamB
LIQLVKTSFVLTLIFFLCSCFGPVKELKYQIEDSWEDSASFADNPTPLDDLDNKIELLVQSKYSISGESKRNFKIALSDDKVFYTSEDGLVSCLNIINNEILWDFRHNEKITSGLAVDTKNIYFVDYAGYLNALSFKGFLEWRAFVGEVYAPPLASSESVIIRTSSNRFISLNIIDGQELWAYQLPIPSLSMRSWGEMSLKDNVVYSGLSSGKIIALNASNGSLIWETTYSQPKGASEIERSNDTTSKPVVDDSIVYIVASSGNVAALSRVDGGVLWSRPLSSFVGMGADSEMLYISHNSGSIYAVDKESNKVKWRNSDFLGRDVSKPIFFKNYVIVSDYEGYLHFLDNKTGKALGRIKVSSSLILEPIIFQEGESLIIGSITGDLMLISINSDKFNNNSKVESDEKMILNENINDKEKIKAKSDQDDESIIDTLIFWE